MEKKQRIWIRWVLILMFALFIAILVSLSSGSAKVPLDKIFSLDKSNIDYTIIFNIRIPRILLALIIGGALSVSGVIFQGLFRNPLVEPYTLGVSGGAALFVSLVVSAGINIILPVAGFAGALSAICILYFISRKNSSTMLLSGVMLSFISASLVMLVMAVSGKSELQSIIFWMMGTLQSADKNMIWVTYILILAGVAAAFFYSHDLNALILGEESAAHLGVNVEKTKKVLFLLGSFITGLCVSLSGIIGFVGLVVPHFMRAVVGNDHRILIVSSFLAGGIFLLLSDTIARTIISPLELPVGVITGIVGGSIFVYFLVRGKR